MMPLMVAWACTEPNWRVCLLCPFWHPGSGLGLNSQIWLVLTRTYGVESAQDVELVVSDREATR